MRQTYLFRRYKSFRFFPLVFEEAFFTQSIIFEHSAFDNKLYFFDSNDCLNNVLLKTSSMFSDPWAISVLFRLRAAVAEWIRCRTEELKGTSPHRFESHSRRCGLWYNHLILVPPSFGGDGINRGLVCMTHITHVHFKNPAYTAQVRICSSTPEVGV